MSVGAYAQNGCTTLGQTPSTAFPVCGTNTFSQSTVPACPGAIVPTYCAQAIPDANPFYYKFTCFKAGTLGFTITPNNQGDDYDWQLFDITGQSPNNIYTDKSLVVGANWSGSYGNTGASSAGVATTECPSNPAQNEPTFSTMPSLVVGHTYLLLISHYTTTNQSGYSLNFTGGSASISDTTNPLLQSTQVLDCGNTTVRVYLDKNMLCSSLAADGSDFVLSLPGSTTPVGPAIVSASGDNCNSGFDMDSLTLTFAGPIPAGNYLLSMKKGSDGNTILDICNNSIHVGDSVAVSIPTPPPPGILDSIKIPACTPATLYAVFSKGILCSSVATDGSNFKITGPSAVSVTGATCTGDSSHTVAIQLSAPIYQGGTYQVQFGPGSTGTTVVDECYQTLVPATLSVTVADTVSALIDYTIALGCSQDAIDFTNPGGNGIDSWTWTFDDTLVKSGEDQLMSYKVYGEKSAKLVVSNGVCSDSTSITLDLDNTLKAVFEATNLLCPNDKAFFTDSSIGNITSYTWLFGDGTTSNLVVPPAKEYPAISVNTNFVVQLIVTNAAGCADTASQIIQDIANCYIAVPSAFTPNGDGINDYLYPLNAYKATNLEFRVFDRWGNLVFQTEDWTRRWDGTVDGHQSPVGTYVWTLRYTNSETGEKVVQKGTSVLIR